MSARHVLGSATVLRAWPGCERLWRHWPTWGTKWICRTSRSAGGAGSRAGKRRRGLGAHRQGTRARPRDRGARGRTFSPPYPRRNLVKTRSGEPGGGGGIFPRRYRDSAASEGAKLRAARGALAGEALSVDRPRRRRPRRGCPRARRLFADAGIPEPGSAGAVRCTAFISQIKEAATSGNGRNPSAVESNTWYPRLTAAMILLGSLVQVKGFGFALVWSRKRWMASLSSWRERNTPRLRRFLVSFAKKLSTAFSHEADVGVK